MCDNGRHVPMKTTASLKIFRIGAVALLAAAVAVITIQPAHAGRISHSLVLAENSSTDLVATYDGSASVVDVIFISGDHWGVTVGFPVTFSGTPQWTEPEDASFVNVLTTFGNNQLIINSDFFPNNTTPLADGSTFSNFGTDSRDAGSISVTFNDHGDVQAVPDTGSTFSLLLVSVIALFGAAGFRSRQLPWLVQTPEI
jgi:hypothetical protein